MFWRLSNAYKDIVINAKFNNYYDGVINSSFRFSYIFDIKEQPIFKVPAVSIHTYSKDANMSFPILFIVERQKSVLSWQLPISLDDRYSTYFRNMSRILCPELNKSIVDQRIIVDIFTMSNMSITYLIYGKIIEIDLSESLTNVSITPSSPIFFLYKFPQDVSQVIVMIESTDELCSILAVQNSQCPVYDSISTVSRATFRQTVTYRGAITLQKNSLYLANSFFILLIVKPNDLDCAGLQKLIPYSGNSNRKKIYTSIRIDMIKNQNQFLIAFFAPLTFFLSFYAVAFFIGLGYNYNIRKARIIQIDSNEQEVDEIIGPTRSYGSIGIQKENNYSTSESYSNSIESSVASEQRHKNDNEENMVNIEVFISVADLSKKSHRSLEKKYTLYTWNIITISIFYVLPVIQLMLTYQMVVNKTGDEDTCFYNFFCANRLGVLSSFNNVYSNIGYILLGILFIILVYKRDQQHGSLLLCGDRTINEYGIPQHFGVFYAMGIALVMEGILSACYHVCPNYSNFQFDTSFMYMIGWLCMIKIYQTRHHDINTQSHIAYCIIAFIVLIGVIGVTGGSKTVWISFSILYILCSLLLSIQVYYMGDWSFDRGVIYRLYRSIMYYGLFTTRPLFLDRLLLLIMANIVNLTLATFGVIQMPYDFASYLLAIVILNLLMYFLFYIVMKLRNREKIRLIPLIFIITATIFWIFALYFFMIKLTSWQVSPAMSRERNENCLLLDFYDSHDIWHFLSAISLFLSFMILLTLDDDLQDVPRDCIRVF